MLHNLIYYLGALLGAKTAVLLLCREDALRERSKCLLQRLICTPFITCKLSFHFRTLNLYFLFLWFLSLFLDLPLFHAFPFSHVYT